MKGDGGEEVEEGGEGRGERGRVAKVTKDPQVRPLQQFVRAETEKSQATPAQKSQVTPDRSHKRPLYPPTGCAKKIEKRFYRDSMMPITTRKPGRK